MYYSARDEGICNVEDFIGSFALKGKGKNVFNTNRESNKKICMILQGMKEYAMLSTSLDHLP